MVRVLTPSVGDRRGGKAPRRIVVAFAAGLALALPASAAAEERTIRIATEAANPPFTYRDQNGEPQGFEIELARAFCDAMKARCAFVVHEWDGIFRDLIRREYDAIVSSVAITPRRRARIAFSIPYYRLPSAFVGRREEPPAAPSPGSLAGRVVGVVDGTPQAAYLEAAHPEAEIRRFAKFDEAALDLLAERVDLVLAGKIAAAKFLAEREGACCRIVADAPYDPAHYGEGVAVGLRPDDPELKARFDAAIAQTMRDGTYDRIRARHFPFDLR